MPAARRRHPRFSAIFDRLFDHLPVRISTSDLHHWILRKKIFHFRAYDFGVQFSFNLEKSATIGPQNFESNDAEHAVDKPGRQQCCRATLYCVLTDDRCAIPDIRLRCGSLHLPRIAENVPKKLTRLVVLATSAEGPVFSLANFAICGSAPALDH